MWIVGQTSVDLVTLTCGSACPVFHGTVILPDILTIWGINIILWDYESIWHNVWPQTKPRSLWPILNGPVILSYTCIMKTIWYMNIILSVWANFGLTISVGHSVLYFMVLWFYLISWRLFGVWTSYMYFGITSQYDWTFDLKIFVCHCDLYFMVQWFCLIVWRLSICVHHTLGLTVSMTQHLTSK